MSNGQPPYLSLTVSQAAVLPAPPAPEPVDHQTFLSLLQHRAEHQSSQIAAGFPELQDEVKDESVPCLIFTFGQLLSLSAVLALNLRHILQERKPAQRENQPVIAILGPSGIDFLLHVLACWRLGAAILPIALGTPAEGAAKLLEICRCETLLFDLSQKEEVDAIKSILSHGQDHFIAHQWFDRPSYASEGAKNPVVALYKVQPNDSLIIFHSSGSSGTPKPLAQSHKVWSTSLLSASGRDQAAFTTTPLFHGGMSDFFRSVQASAALYFFPWHQKIAPTVDNIVRSVRSSYQPIRYFLSVPFILEGMMKSDEGSDLLATMDLVSTGGAPLSEAVGDVAVMTKNIKLVSRLGSSECGFLMSSFREFESEKDWSWLRLSDQLGKSLLQFEPVDSEEEVGVFELVVSSKWPSKQLANRADGSFATGDLYERHPKKSDRWRYKRRGDDVVVMVNGKKIAGSLIESALCRSPLIDEAIVFGANRALLGAVVFTAVGVDDVELFRHQLQHFLHSINSTLPSHARLAMELIHVGDKALRQSLPRSSKGTLQKGMALEKMVTLIDNIYRRFEEGEAPSTERKKSLQGEELRTWIKALVDNTCESKGIGWDDDFYRAGIDSIIAARIRAGIHQGLDLAGFQLKSNDIYEHPTITLLSRFIDRRGAEQNKNREEVMQEMVERYSTFSPMKAKEEGHAPSTGKKVFFLTGATGALGTRILHELVTGCHRADKVICLVRAKDSLAGRKRVQAALKDRDIAVEDKKYDCITGLWEMGMRLDVLRASSLSVIHCAWIVNFALRLESFEQDCIAALKDLLDFFRTCPNADRFLFCSSLASVLNGEPPFTEEVSTRHSDAGSTGYAQSKWVAEHICRKAGSQVYVARVGQLCGDTEAGIWNTSEAWPLMIRTANEVGALPDAGPDIDWLPVDRAAKAIVEVISTHASSSPRIFHIALPSVVVRPSWKRFLQWLRNSGVQFTAQPKEEWLRRVTSKRDQVRGNPLLDIWAKIPAETSTTSIVETKEGTNASSALAQTQAMDEQLCKKMVMWWRKAGFLSN